MVSCTSTNKLQRYFNGSLVNAWSTFIFKMNCQDSRCTMKQTGQLWRWNLKPVRDFCSVQPLNQSDPLPIEALGGVVTSSPKQISLESFNQDSVQNLAYFDSMWHGRTIQATELKHYVSDLVETALPIGNCRSELHVFLTVLDLLVPLCAKWQRQRFDNTVLGSHLGQCFGLGPGGCSMQAWKNMAWAWAWAWGFPVAESALAIKTIWHGLSDCPI